MDDVRTYQEEDVMSCPHVDRNDARCGNRFTIGSVDQTLSVCFGAFGACPMYHQINRDDGMVTARSRREPPLITVTVSADGSPQPLLPTGT